MKLPLQEILQILALPTLIIFAGLASAVAKWQEARKNSLPHDKVDFFINFVLATFAGTAFSYVPTVIGLEGDAWVRVFATTGAVLGWVGLNALGLRVLDMINSFLKR